MRRGESKGRGESREGKGERGRPECYEKHQKEGKKSGKDRK
jgi:hypothetical protein